MQAATGEPGHVSPPSLDSRICCRILRVDKTLSVELIYLGAAFTPAEHIAGPGFSIDSEGGFDQYIIEQSVAQIECRTLIPGIKCVRPQKRGLSATGGADV